MHVSAKACAAKHAHERSAESAPRGRAGISSGSTVRAQRVSTFSCSVRMSWTLPETRGALAAATDALYCSIGRLDRAEVRNVGKLDPASYDLGGFRQAGTTYYPSTPPRGHIEALVNSVNIHVSDPRETTRASQTCPVHHSLTILSSTCSQSHRKPTTHAQYTHPRATMSLDHGPESGRIACHVNGVNKISEC